MDQTVRLLLFVVSEDKLVVCVPSKTAQGATIPFSEEGFFFWEKLHCICQILFLQKYIYPKDAT